MDIIPSSTSSFRGFCDFHLSFWPDSLWNLLANQFLLKATIDRPGSNVSSTVKGLIILG